MTSLQRKARCLESAYFLMLPNPIAYHGISKVPVQGRALEYVSLLLARSHRGNSRPTTNESNMFRPYDFGRKYQARVAIIGQQYRRRWGIHIHYDVRDTLLAN